MNIKIISDYGYCYGVENAIKILIKVSEDHSPVFLSHPLIHNMSANRRLMEMTGSEELSDIDQVEEQGAVVFSAHGHRVEEEQALKDRTHVFDAICPLIKARYELIDARREDDMSFLFLGKPSHQETIGFISHFPFLHLIDVDEPLADQIDALVLKEKIFLIPQTTIGSDVLYEAISSLKRRGEVTSLDICPIYKRRSTQALEFLRSVDTDSSAVIVAGDPSSSNAREIARSIEKNHPELPLFIATSVEQIDIGALKGRDIYMTSATSVSREDVERLCADLHSLLDVV